jgi:hypothetical protein
MLDNVPTITTTTDENAHGGGETHAQRAERGQDQAGHNDRPASHAVCQRAAEGAACHAGHREDRKEDPDGGHADIEFLGEVQRKERVEHEAAQAVDEHDEVVHPECLGYSL